MNINYDMTYQYMVVIPEIEERRRERFVFGESGIVTRVKKVEGNGAREIRRDDGLGRNVDIYV